MSRFDSKNPADEEIDRPNTHTAFHSHNMNNNWVYLEIVAVEWYAMIEYLRLRLVSCIAHILMSIFWHSNLCGKNTKTKQTKISFFSKKFRFLSNFLGAIGGITKKAAHFTWADWRAFLFIEGDIGDWFLTNATNEMFWMPWLPQSSQNLYKIKEYRTI